MISAAQSPAISVLMTVFNERPEWLRRAAHSILNQTFRDFEFIIIDDGSSNQATLNELKTLNATGDRRLRIIQQENTGLTLALNRAIALSNGRFMCRQDSDDWSEPDRFEKQLTYMNENPETVLVGSATQLYDEDSRPYGTLTFPATHEDIRRCYPFTNPICHGTVCARLSTVRKLGCYRDDLNIFAEDYDLFWRMSEHGPVANLPDVLYHRLYRMSSMTVTRSKERKLAVEAIRLLAKSRSEGQEIAFEKAIQEARTKDWNAAEMEVNTADEMMRAGAYWQSFRRYLSALKYAPFYWQAWAKIGRLLIYVIFPWWRWRMFRDPYREMGPPRNF